MFLTFGHQIIIDTCQLTEVLHTVKKSKSECYITDFLIRIGFTQKSFAITKEVNDSS